MNVTTAAQRMFSNTCVEHLRRQSITTVHQNEPIERHNQMQKAFLATD